MANLADFTDEEIAAAMHFLDAHLEDLDPQELRAWRVLLPIIIGRAQSHRDVAADDAANQSTSN